jgi:hypothetical protein
MTPELRAWLENLVADDVKAADEELRAGPRRACPCGASLRGKRSHAIYHPNACRQRAYRRPRSDSHLP